MWFNSIPKTLNSLEYETLVKRILDVSSRVEALELSNDNFRNQILRKMQKHEVKPDRFRGIPSPPQRIQ